MGDSDHRRAGRILDLVEAAFFDLDKTVIAKASMVAFHKPLRRAGFLSRRLVLRALYGQLVYMYFGADEDKMEQVREQALRITKGWDQAVVSEIVAESLEQVIEPIVFDEAIDLIDEHQAAGRRVYIVSASPEEIVLPLARYLGVDGAIATRAKVDEDGCYTGEMEFYSYGPNKAVAIVELARREGIDLAGSYAYSDSETDIPMLEVVGHPVAVNPDRSLLRRARDSGWGTASFVRRVRLRDRRAVRVPLIALGAGAGAAAVAAGVWWWATRRASTPPARWGRRRTGR